MDVNFHIHRFREDLYLISLPVPITGFDGFIGAWLHVGDPLVLVDVGPAVSAPYLLSALSELGFGPPDLILITHIHIDHAGGLGAVAAAFPGARVICHPKGVRHLVDPERLWIGSLKTLGPIARAYEPIAPVAAEMLIAHDQLQHPSIRCLETPGHAAHHVSYMIEDLLFAGEAGGVCLPMADQTLYLRPATPPRFFLETSLASIDRLIAKSPQRICYGHIGQRDNAMEMLTTHRNQLLVWLDMIRPFQQAAGDRDEAMQACAEYLLANDPLLQGFDTLSPDTQARERNFIANSIKGYWGYLEELV